MMGPSKAKPGEILKEVADPYRWMEDDTPKRRKWVQAQHEQAIAHLSDIPARADIRHRLTQVIAAPQIGVVTKAGSRYFFRQRHEDQELFALYYCERLDEPARLLFDPIAASPDGAITIADTHPSPDGSRIAYRLSERGSSCMSLYVMDVESRQVLDMIPGNVNPVAHAWHTRNRVAWLPDNSGFYYTRCPHELAHGQARFHHKLYYHRIGDDWRSDDMVFGESLRREQTPYPMLSCDGRYLAVLVQDVSGDAPESQLHLLNREDSQRSFSSILHAHGVLIEAAFHRDKLYIRTNHDGRQGKLLAFNLPVKAGGSARTIICAGSCAIRSWATAANYLFVETMADATSKLCVYDLEGNFIKEIVLPDRGSIEALTGETEADELFFSFSSFLMAKAAYRVNLKTLDYQILHQSHIAFDPDAFTCEQVWFESRDQTRVPMFLVHRKGLTRDGNNAAVVHGYGGFGISLLPKFTAHVIPFLEHGGVYAIVNARGGGEFGEAWHRAAVRANKQNTFDDFIGAGEWLISQGFTQAAKLGCFGWSNGGLSVEAVAVQRPDLWKAVVAGAPVTDMARFHLAHGGSNWIADYGSPNDPADLDKLMRYSPYHTLPEEIEAPAFLTIAPGNDDRVAPWHSYKMHAAWQAANASSSPILLRAEDQAGHRGSPLASRAIDLYTDIWSFFFQQLGVD